MLRPAGLGQKRRRQFRPLSLTDRHHDLPVAPHRLWQQPVPARPNAVGQADITWVETDEGWLYVAGIWDRCTRRGVGWARGDTLHPTLPRAAGPLALTQQRPPPGRGHHSDRGGQYARPLYRQNLSAAGATATTTPRGKASGAR